MKRWNLGKQIDFLDWRYLLMKSPLPSQSYLHKTQIRLSTMIHQHKPHVSDLNLGCLFFHTQKMGQKPPCFSHLHFWEQQKPQTAILLFIQLPQLRVLRSSFWKPNTSWPIAFQTKNTTGFTGKMKRNHDFHVRAIPFCHKFSYKIQLERHRILAPLSSKCHANWNRPQFHSIAALPLQFLHWPCNGREKRFWTWETW